jgi:hypothetical protein
MANLICSSRSFWAKALKGAEGNRVQGSGFRVKHSRELKGTGFRIQDSGFRV